MKLKTRWLHIIYVTTIFTACSNFNSSKEFQVDFPSAEQEEFYFNIGESSSISSDAHLSRETYYVRNNPSLSMIEIFDFKLKSKIKEIPLQREGPDGIGKGQYGFYYQNEDSLFVSNNSFLFLLNDSGKVVRRYRLIDKTLGSQPDIVLESTKPIKIKDGKLYAAIYPHISAFKKEDLKSWKNFMRLDLETGDFLTFGALPKEMQNNIYGFNFLNHSFLFQDDRILMVFAPINAIYTIDYDNLENMVEHDLSLSDWNTSPKLADEGNEDMMNYFSHFVLHPSYDAIYQHGEKIIIIGQKPNSKDEFQSRVWAKKKVLFIYDKDFKLEKIVDTNSNNFSYLSCFSLDEWFYLLEVSYKEDFIKYRKLKLDEN